MWIHENALYEGWIVNDKFFGEGRIMHEKFIYIGQLEGFNMEGKGNLIRADGEDEEVLEKYEGQFKDSLMHGEGNKFVLFIIGIYEFSNGDKYYGKFYKNKKQDEKGELIL